MKPCSHIPPFKGRIAGASLRMEEVRGFLEECILRHKVGEGGS